MYYYLQTLHDHNKIAPCGMIKAFWIELVDETSSCHLLIMLGKGQRCKELGDKFFSAYWSNATTKNISDTLF